MFLNEINSHNLSKIRHQKSLILGGSKGLGCSISGCLPNSKSLSRSSSVESVDLSQPASIALVEKHLLSFGPDLVFYVAGGGVYGEYFSKPMHSHRWTFEVNFFRPTQIADLLKKSGFKGKFIYIGSAIAERSESLKCISYSYSKKLAVKTLLSLSEEDLKVRVFSPPYMDTDLLPKNSWPRLESPQLVLNTQVVAAELLKWLAEDSSKDFKTLSEDFDPRHFDWIQRFKYTLPIDKNF